MTKLNDRAIDQQAAITNEAVRIERALAAQPQLAKGQKTQLIGHGFLGDVAVDLWGEIDRGELDLDDVTLAGTTVSLESLPGIKDKKVWDSLQADAQAAYDKDRSPYGVAA
ncbi:MAG: hypothetical protein AAFO57_00295 [Pseudomonadota bacterium]